MSAGINRYKADLRDFEFVLLEQFKLGSLVGQAPFEQWDVEQAKSILNEGYRFVKEELGPLHASGDREGCKLENGQVRTPKGFKEAWAKVYESGFKSLVADPEHGGMGAPFMLYALLEELLSGANIAFSMYPGLTHGAVEVITEFATADQKHRFVSPMLTGKWAGTMCLTEPHAGSDVGSAKTSARKLANGRYALKGTKIYISGGDQDITENIIHLVLARVEGAPAGTKGLSLFIVPKVKVNADGTLGASNDVATASIEHKMGINGSATCVLNFGENGDCEGELVGTVENVGMPQMFKMMNGARIAVGVQGLGIMGSAYLNALEYAKDRKQGPSIKNFKDATAPRVAIVEHADIRRMLLDAKAHLDGCRALVMKLAYHWDRSRQLKGKDDEQAAYHHGQVELLTPIVKAFTTDEAFRVCENMIQVYGGAGYLKDWPVEQYARDAKILSIYEGTNHIQAMDLVGRKMGQSGGANYMGFMQDVGNFLEQHKSHPRLGADVQQLGAALEALQSTAMLLLGWSQGGELQNVPLAANRFLQMMGRLTVGWLLLEQAIIADAALQAGTAEKAFYEGKVFGARYFARNLLPLVEGTAKVLAGNDTSSLDIPVEAFGN
jgi:alkylation response protein AidB-like acyl-CoA dehydrogenase